MSIYLDEESLIIDSGRTGYYHRILTETSVEVSPKIVTQKILLIPEQTSSRIETERVHTEPMIYSKVKSTFQYFKQPTKGIYSIAREKNKSGVNIGIKEKEKESRSRVIKQPEMSLFRSKYRKDNENENLNSDILMTPLKRQGRKFLDLTESKTTATGAGLSIDATNQSLSKSIITDKSKSKVTKTHVLGRHLQPIIQNIPRKY